MSRLRSALIVPLAVFALVPGWTGEERLALLGRDATMTTRRVALDPHDVARRRVGTLTYMGGIVLSSRDPAFGGFSSLAVAGDHVTMLSDGGNVVGFRLHGDGTASDVSFGNLPAGPGTGWEKRDRDAESLAVDPRTGTAWVGFEDSNAIWRYSSGLARAQAQVRPRAMRRWRSGGGAETLVRRRDGSFLVIAEEPLHAGDPTRQGLVFHSDPTAGGEPWRFRYRPPAGYDPSDATELPDGRLLVLNRRLSLRGGFTAILVMIDRGAVHARSTVAGTVIARLAAPLTHDNMEGVAATVERGRTIVWLASDDNQTWPQRSLLLKFALD